MHASRQPCEPRRWQARDDHAVSEVVGQMLMFGILSMVLIMTLFSFNIAKQSAEERVLDATAASVAQRVASLVVDTALFTETFQDDGIHMESRLELPEYLESRRYSIDVGDNAVTVTSEDASQRAPLFSAGSPTVVHICDQDPIEGGSVRIFAVADYDTSDGIVNVDDGNGNPVALAACPAATPSSFYVYLEAAHER